MSQSTIKQDDLIIKLLGVNQIRRVICNTDKGLLELMIRKGETKYFLTLDSVPLDKEVNKELMDILFPVKVEVQLVPKIIPFKEGLENAKYNANVARVVDATLRNELAKKTLTAKVNNAAITTIENQINFKNTTSTNPKRVGRPKKVK